MMNNISLYVNGQVFTGWLSASVSVGLTDVARSFSLEVTQPIGVPKDEIKTGDSVKLFIGEDLVITGWVTKSEILYADSEMKRKISGSSKTIDLTQCFLPNEAPKSYKDKTPSELLGVICGYFGIQFIDLVGKTDKVTVNFDAAGKVFDGLKKALKENSILLTDDEFGRLIITATGAGNNSRDSLELGVNILSAKKTEDAAELFRDYVVIGTPKNAGDTKSASEMRPSETATDTDVRPRTKVVIQTGDANAAKMRVRAALLRDVAKANAVSVDYTVHGWRQSNGELWKVNAKVRIKDRILFPEGEKEFLISKVSFNMDETGQTTTLTCVPAEAFLYTGEKTTADAVKKISKEKKKSTSTQVHKYKTVGDLGQASWTKS